MENDKPLHGKYSFDEDNRKKLPKDIKIPLSLNFDNKYVQEAKIYCKKFKSVGSIDSSFSYPVTFEEASLELDTFINQRFENYGTYQDAMTKDTNEVFLFHSNISSSLNIGLICLDELIEKIVNANAPYNAKEGFIRQIIGWREFMLRIYEDSGVKLRNSNFFNFTNDIPKCVLEGNSGIDILDDVINKVKNHAYAHHIERLMVLGNLFLLLEIHPNKAYEYFMANFIDAYDWVMLGNVYGMSGFSDGGSITTKPYICSSNYLIKMSNYSKTKPWCKIVDALYWNFLHKHSYLFNSNARMKMQIAILNKMPKEKLDNHLKIAYEYLQNSAKV